MSDDVTLSFLSAYTYESCFDELVVDEYYEEQGQLDEEVSYPTHAEAPTSLPLGPPCPPQGTNSDDSHFNPEQKRISTDSGMGIDEDPGSTRGSIQYTRRKYSNKSMGVNSDSGMIVRIVRKFCRRFLKNLAQ